MKKFLAVLLAGMSLMIPTYAETVDLSTMSLDELIQLRDAVNAAINEQLNLGFDDSKIGMGYYDVGIDIKPGKYDLICTFVETEHLSVTDTDQSQCMVVVVSDRSEKAEALCEFYYITVGQQISVELEEGNVLVIARGNFLIQSSEHSWAP